MLSFASRLRSRSRVGSLAATLVPLVSRPNPATNRTLRRQLLHQLVEQIHADPYQPTYRRRPHGKPVTGWDARLNAYFWPDPTTTYAVTARRLDPWFRQAGTLSQALLRNGSWTPAERTTAARLAWEMLVWGGVTRQKLFSETTVEQVFREALDLPTRGDVPMNSGWTKVAALATASLETDPTLEPHAIWDSRVSASITSRLDTLMAQSGLGHPKRVFPHIGQIPGRGGTRPRTLRLRWAHAYGKWSSQRAGSVLVRELRDLLNASYPPMPLPGGGVGSWTVRGIESVLFMDGY